MNRSAAVAVQELFPGAKIRSVAQDSDTNVPYYLVVADVDLELLRRHRYSGTIQPWNDRRSDLYGIAWGDPREEGEKV